MEGKNKFTSGQINKALRLLCGLPFGARAEVTRWRSRCGDMFGRGLPKNRSEVHPETDKIKRLERPLERKLPVEEKGTATGKQKV